MPFGCFPAMAEFQVFTATSDPTGREEEYLPVKEIAHQTATILRMTPANAVELLNSHGCSTVLRSWPTRLDSLLIHWIKSAGGLGRIQQCFVSVKPNWQW